MAVVTWDGSSSTDYETAANWDTNSVPTSSDDVIIPDTSSINNCELPSSGANPQNVNSFKIEANGTVIGNDIAIRVYGENGSGFAVDNDGIISGNLNLIIKTSSTTTCDFNGTSGNFKNVEIDHASADIHLSGNTTFDGNLTITAGTFDCSNEGGDSRNLTVSGDISNSGTLTGNASAISSRKLTTTGTLNGGNFTVTGAGLSATTRTTDLGGTVSGNVDITLTGAGSNRHEDLQASGNIRNLTINNAAAVVHTGRNTTIDGDLTITAGTLSTDDSGTSVDLTVAGDCIVGDGAGSADTAVLTGNASAISLGSLTLNSDGKYDATSGTTTITSEISGDYALDKHASGTFAHNNGTVTVTTNTNTFFRGFEGTDTSGTGANAINNLIVNLTGASGYYLRLRPNSGTAHTILGDVTVTQGKLEKETNDHTLTINGDVSVGANGTLGHADKTGNDTFGSLTIESGGTAIATQGTTTITSMTSTGSGDRSLNNKSGGTFTNNNGTVLFNGSSDQRIEMAGTGNVHNVTLNKSDNDFVWMSNSTFEGDFDITLETTHVARPTGTANTLTVTGDVIVREGILLRGQNDCTGAMSFGSLTIESGGTYAATSGTTTFTDETSGGHALYAADGTFTHNNGKVKVDYNTGNKNAHTILVNSGDYYDLEIDMNSVAYEVKLDAPSPSKINILNNLTITTGWVEKSDASDTLDVFGLTNISANGKFMEDANENTNTITHHGLVTNLGTYKINDGTTVKMNGGIRNLGTITVA